MPTILDSRLTSLVTIIARRVRPLDNARGTPLPLLLLLLLLPLLLLLVLSLSFLGLVLVLFFVVAAATAAGVTDVLLLLLLLLLLLPPPLPQPLSPPPQDNEEFAWSVSSRISLAIVPVRMVEWGGKVRQMYMRIHIPHFDRGLGTGSLNQKLSFYLLQQSVYQVRGTGLHQYTGRRAGAP